MNLLLNDNAKIQNYINGALRTPLRHIILTISILLQEKYTVWFPDSDERDVALATEAAQEAFQEWSTMPKERRVACWWNSATRSWKPGSFRAGGNRLIRETIVVVKTVDIPKSCCQFSFLCNCRITHTHRIPLDGRNSVELYSSHTRIGVAGCISPWNLPLYLFTWKIAPALAAGCTVLAKPSEITPMTAYLLSELCVSRSVFRKVYLTSYMDWDRK